MIELKKLSQLISEYTNLLQKKEIQVAYKGIIDYINKLSREVKIAFPDYEVGSVYQGYMDMSYFPLTSKELKSKGLKIAIVYRHEKGTFEVWLSGLATERLQRSILFYLQVWTRTFSMIKVMATLLLKGS